MNLSDHREKIIELLEVVARRPCMYFGSDDNVEQADSFLYGFNLALLRIIDHETINLPAFLEPGHTARGWEFRASSVTKLMKERNFTDQEVVAELIEITISCWIEYFERIKECAE